MADRSDGMCGPSRAPRPPRNRPPRNRQRWIAAAAAVAVWVFLLAYTRSLVAGTALLLLLAVFVTLCTVAVRGLGITSDQHSGAQRTAARQWRDGRDALAHGLRRLADVAAGHAGPAPGYAEPGAGYGRPPTGYAGPAAGVAGPTPGHAEPLASARAYQAGNVYPHDGRTGQPEGTVLAAGTGQLTMAERPVIPPLRLVTGDSIAETRSSGARAGRGGLAELCLPDVPTVSRVHAKFTFTGGQWWITSLGRNGVTLNGTFLADERALMDGDSIRWGSRPDAPASRVEIG
jgi:hypothetical protein